MYELLFLMSFTFHNLEESIWLPNWSKNAGRYHPKVEKREFHFAVLCVTLLGYILTFAFLAAGNSNEIIKYLYFGFVLMMCLNAIFPHLLATIALKKYSPGTLTGLLLNLPIGLYLVLEEHGERIEVTKLIIGLVIMIVITTMSLRPLFKLGKKMIDEY